MENYPIIRDVVTFLIIPFVGWVTMNVVAIKKDIEWIKKSLSEKKEPGN